MDDKKYAISVNKPRRSVRIHLMTCGSRKVHMNKKGNQIHIEDLNLETARKINESYEYEDKNFCDLCLRELRKEHTSTIKTQDKSSSKESEIKGSEFDVEIQAHAEYVTDCLHAWIEASKLKKIPDGSMLASN